MTQARPEVRASSPNRQPVTGHREVFQSREAVLVDATHTVIRNFPHLTVTEQGRASLPAPMTAEPAGRAHPADADTGAGVADPAVTTEELAILTLMASGLTLDSVAVRVSMSPRTLSRRLRCVCDRLGVAHPIQAIVWAAHRGLI